MLWLSEIAGLIFNLYVDVAVCNIVQADLSRSMLLGR